MPPIGPQPNAVLAYRSEIPLGQRIPHQGGTVAEPTIGVAIQGAGWVSSEHIRAYQNNPHVRVVAIGSRTKEGAERKAREFGLDVPVFDRLPDLLSRPDVDAISLCTPPGLHSDETVLAAQAGKHILIEKPVAVDLEQLRRMRDAVRDNQVRTVVSFVLRWNLAVQNIKALKANGMLGSVFHVQTDYWHNLDQAGLSDHGGGVSAMLAGGCHAVDAARNLMESDIVSVSARSWTPDDRHAGEKGHIGNTNTVALLHFANGGIGKVSACTSQWMPYNFNIDVFGTDGAVRGNRFFTKHLPGLTDFATLPTILPDNGDVAHHPFQAEIDHFIDCIRSGAESPVSLADAVNTHEACLAADLSSARDGATIALPLL
jgi:predicted dehydrogenase